MEEREGGTEQLVALGRAERAHIADAVTVEVGCYFPVEIVPIVNDARDHKRKPDRPRYRDRIGYALVGVHPSEIDKTAAGLLPRSELGEVDAVINGRDVGQVGVPVGIADRDVRDAIVVSGEHGHDPLR